MYILVTFFTRKKINRKYNQFRILSLRISHPNMSSPVSMSAQK